MLLSRLRAAKATRLNCQQLTCSNGHTVILTFRARAPCKSLRIIARATTQMMPMMPPAIIPLTPADDKCLCESASACHTHFKYVFWLRQSARCCSRDCWKHSSNTSFSNNLYWHRASAGCSSVVVSQWLRHTGQCLNDMAENLEHSQCC